MGMSDIGTTLKLCVSLSALLGSHLNMQVQALLTASFVIVRWK